MSIGAWCWSFGLVSDPSGSTLSEIFLVWIVDFSFDWGLRGLSPCWSTYGVFLVFWSRMLPISAMFWPFGKCAELTSSTWAYIYLRVWGGTSSRVGSLGRNQLVLIISVFNTLILSKDNLDITPLGLTEFSWLWTDKVYQYPTNSPTSTRAHP